MRKILGIFALLSLAFFIVSITPVFAQPHGPKTGDIWICPSVSIHNPHGGWVVGTHGAYYILKPGTSSPKWPDILNPTENLGLHAPHVEDLAQVPAGFGHYKDVPTYPYFEGDAMVLPEGAVWGLTPGEVNSITADQEIPLASAVFW
jgi:hypothetical protein